MAIRVNQFDLQAYGEEANHIFAHVGDTLATMVQDAGTVVYKGRNAQQFRADLLRLATDFAGAITEDMENIALAVASSTSAISGSLGGDQIQINAPTLAQAVAAPDDEEGDHVTMLETGTLNTYMETARGHFQDVGRGFDQHQARLEGTDWDGQAKVTAVSAVGDYTSSAHSAISQATSALEEFINAQVSTAETADSA